MNQQDKYCIFIPGPDDIYAMPSKEMAEKCAELHNKSMDQWLQENKAKGMGWVTEEMVFARVKKYPGTRAEHAEALKEFYETEWFPKGAA